MNDAYFRCFFLARELHGTSRVETMASRASKIAAVAREIFGTLPIRGVRTGMQYLKTPLTGAYEARFYMEPIEPIARKVRSKNSLPYLSAHNSWIYSVASIIHR